MPFRTRRGFVSFVGAGLAAPLIPQTLSPMPQAESAPVNLTERSRQALLLRLQRAREQATFQIPEQLTNGDSERYPSHFANFSKALVHDDLGIVAEDGYAALLNALASGKWADFEAVPIAGKAKLVEPLAAVAYSLEGCDCHDTWTEAPPAFASAEQASELIELYWHALTRDVAFSDFPASATIQDACTDLSRLGPSSAPGVNGAVTPQTIFRAAFPGCLNGPYLSQFLWLNIPVDNIIFPQQYPVLLSGLDHMTEYTDWLNIQNGMLPVSSALSPARYMLSARDLCAYVHRDVSCQSALNAALIMNSFGAAAWSDANPYKQSATQAPFVAFGLPGFIDWVVRSANTALKAAWYHKWLVHRRLRPEEFAGRVQLHLTSKAAFPIADRLFQSTALKRIYDVQGTYLLSQAYDEGCPVHPSYPAAHATIAGAAVTALKALFNEDFAIPAPVVPSPAGDSITPYTDEVLTIGSELNKLAANIALGRDAAGVHWRSDTEAGLRLGEQVAIRLLRDLRAITPDALHPLSFHAFDGQQIVIQ